MDIDKVTFRKHDGLVNEVIEVQLSPGNFGVFPAHEVIAGSVPAQTWAERYKVAFDAFKGGAQQPSELATRAAAGDAPQLAARNLPAKETEPKAKAKAPKKQAPAKKAKQPAAKKKARAKAKK
jgi:hypothetical protein